MAELLGFPLLTADASKAGLLERMVGKNTTSYKYYWLRAIVDEVSQGNASMSFTRLVARMAASAWFPVVYYHLSLGVSDRLFGVVDYVRSAYAVPNDCPQGKIVSLIEDECARDAKLAKLVRERTANVPYRLIRPFYEEGVAKAKAADPAWSDPKVDPVVFRLNRAEPEACIYEIWPDRDGLTVNPEWAAFINENLPVIDGWLDYRLTQYLQARNPSVPAISSKLRPPVARDLSAARTYWRQAIRACDLHDIYSGKPFDEESFGRYGVLSIDHFVPWSFVLHDEPWNLIPMFKNVNSAKSDKLPSLERYLQSFCLQQFKALIAMRNAKVPRSIRESYLSIDAHVNEYEDSDVSREAFAASLTNAILPLYQIALNQGYSVWHYDEHYAVVKY